MKQIEFERNGVTFIFNCDTVYGCNGFWHHCNMWAYSPLTKLTGTKRHYTNRTWELYDYQSVCLDAVDTVLKQVVTDELAVYKEANGYKVMSAKRMAVFNQWVAGCNRMNRYGFETGKLYTALAEAKQALRDGLPSYTN